MPATIDKSKLIELLNTDLASEYQAVIMDTTYAASVSGPHRPTLRSFFQAEIPEELRHAQFLADKISSLGGIPSVQPTPVPVPRLASVAVLPSFGRQSTQQANVQPGIATDTRAHESTNPAPSAATGATPTRMAVESSRPTRKAGSTEFISAKATTWVNVRAEANGRSAIVGIILPDSIVELGESRRGWRRVDTRWLSGWASAKLFAVDSIRRWAR